MNKSELITEQEARERWKKACAQRSWQKRKIYSAMFESPSKKYHPSPAWTTIANSDNCARLSDYLRLQESLLKQGEGPSRGGQTSRVASGALVDLCPMEINANIIIGTILRTIQVVHPLLLSNQQVLRCSFVNHLPSGLGSGIGTPCSAVHPERPTPSTYKWKGKEGSRWTRGRYDLGFGHLKDQFGIVGAVELEVSKASFDTLRPSGKIAADEPEDDLLPTDRPEKDSLAKDFFKLLDPLLPREALRISWVVVNRRGQSTPEAIVDKAKKVIERVEQKLNLPVRSTEINPRTGWLQWIWAESGISLQLAWYRPQASDLARFEPLWETYEQIPSIS